MDISRAGEVRSMIFGIRGWHFQVLEDGFPFFTEYSDGIVGFLNGGAGRFDFRKNGIENEALAEKDNWDFHSN